MNMFDYKSGWDAGKVAGKMDAILESANHNVALTNARWAGEMKALKEIKQELHNIYSECLYCPENKKLEHEHEPMCEAMGSDCEDCLYAAFEKAIDKKLEVLNDCAS